MKNHKEIMEALLAGETLVHCHHEKQTARLEDGTIIGSRFGAPERWRFDAPADWSILDTTVGLIEALAALDEGKQVRHKPNGRWVYKDTGGVARYIDNAAAVQLTTNLATARFVVRNKP